MDPLDFLVESAQLQQFFHSRKNQLSCLKNPQIFLRQLKDYNLIPEDRYKKVINMKSKEKRGTAIYKMLECLETERSEHIPKFWECVFKDFILSQYPNLQKMRKSLMDELQLPPTVEKEEKGKKKDKEARSAKNKERSKKTCGDEEQPGTSSRMNQPQKKFIEIDFGKKIVTWPLSKNQLKVTCGEKKGTLFRDKLAKGKKCIKIRNGQWFTPGEFEKFSGKESSGKWKSSIKYKGIQLGKFIQKGHLQCVKFKKRRKMVNKKTTKKGQEVAVFKKEYHPRFVALKMCAASRTTAF